MAIAILKTVVLHKGSLARHSPKPNGFFFWHKRLRNMVQKGFAVQFLGFYKCKKTIDEKSNHVNVLCFFHQSSGSAPLQKCFSSFVGHPSWAKCFPESKSPTDRGYWWRECWREWIFDVCFPPLAAKQRWGEIIIIIGRCRWAKSIKASWLSFIQQKCFLFLNIMLGKLFVS